MLLHIRTQPRMRLATASGDLAQRTGNRALVDPRTGGKFVLTDPLAPEEIGDRILQFHPPDA